MTQNACETFADKLVDYADGELPADQAAQVAAHLARCPCCRETLAALARSADLARAVWRSAEAELADVRVPAIRKPTIFRFRWPAAVAASIVLLLAGTYLGQHVFNASRTPGTQTPALTKGETTLTLDQARELVMRAGAAMQMLCAAELLAEQPGGEEIAQKRFQFIIDNYPETTAAAEARSRTTSRPQRRI